MRRLARVTIACVLAMTFACKGCDEGTQNTNNQNNTPATNNGTTNNGTTNNAVWPDGCVDEDDDGYPTGLTCSGRVDCDDANADIKPGVQEQCYDDVDNDCDAAIDEGCPDCEEGATRECGSDVGRCVAGEQSCTDGVWTDCIGAEGPFQEICNGEDDNCDGEVDENASLLCDDGKQCNGLEVCTAGACVPGEAVDCSMLNGPCLTGECSEKDGGCRAFPIENGTACDDGLFCTENGVCDAGECVTTPRDCSAEDDACNVGACDETADACVKEPRSDGTTCDDGSFCTVSDVCTAGICGGSTRDCSSVADQCNDGVCDDTIDSCVKQPVANGSTCEDGMFCTVGDTCQAGACTAGGPRACGAAGGSCRDGVCDEATRSCTGDPVPDGTACDDGAYCTVSDSCVAGTCTGGGPRDCSAVAGTCKVASCNENLRVCVPLPAPDGTLCDDGAFCTTNDACSGGACTGAMRSCANVADECNTGFCDDTADACIPRPKSDGTACPDGDFCSVNEVCVAGSCTRANRDCSGAGDECNDGICDDTTDACVPQPKADGSSCNDGLFCTAGDTCTAGVCTGGPMNCSNAGDSCQDGVCDENLDMCTGQAKPDNSVCNDMKICTENDRCLAGVCTGTAKNCSMSGDQCNNGLCNEANGCYASPKSNTTVCSDNSTCTTGDRCNNGTCMGTPVVCNPIDQCNNSRCVEGMVGCQPVPLTGTPCMDGAFCTENDSCVNGSCVGDAVICPNLGDSCFDDVCDEMADDCVQMNNGTCNACTTGTPTANAGPDQEVVPDTMVFLDGTGSSDPSGQTLTYAWTVQSRPPGSTASLQNANTATPSILGDISGDFVICLVVTDSDLCVSNQDCVTVTVKPTADLHIELTWNKDKSDLDLHFKASTIRNEWFDAYASNGNPATCVQGGPSAAHGPDNYWCIPAPDWGGTPLLWSEDMSMANDPRLDVDDVNGFGPENVNHSNLKDGTYSVGVHYWKDYVNPNTDPGAGPAVATIRIFVNGLLQNPVYTRTLDCRGFWEVATVTVSGNGTSITHSGVGQEFRVRQDAVLLNSDGDYDTAPGFCRCPSGGCGTGERCVTSGIADLCCSTTPSKPLSCF